MDGVNEVDESLGHDETQDEAHADDYGIGRGTHPAKEEVRTEKDIWGSYQPGREKLCHNNPNEGAIASIPNEEEDTDGEGGDPADVTRIRRNHLRYQILWQILGSGKY